jgi:hypothetical protein
MTVLHAITAVPDRPTPCPPDLEYPNGTRREPDIPNASPVSGTPLPAGSVDLVQRYVAEGVP